MAAEAIINSTDLIGVLLGLAMVFVYLIVREIRIMKTSTRRVELELEKDKLELLKQHEVSKVFSFTRLTPEQISTIKTIEDDNASLETNIYAKQKLVEIRLSRLENLVKTKKLDKLLGNIQEQEKKVK
jgi:hypothetical protein